MAGHVREGGRRRRCARPGAVGWVRARCLLAGTRDRLRQDALEGLGWRIYRIWGPTWFRFRADEEQRLREALAEAIPSQAPKFAGAHEPPSDLGDTGRGAVSSTESVLGPSGEQHHGPSTEVVVPEAHRADEPAPEAPEDKGDGGVGQVPPPVLEAAHHDDAGAAETPSGSLLELLIVTLVEVVVENGGLPAISAYRAVATRLGRRGPDTPTLRAAYDCVARQALEAGLIVATADDGIKALCDHFLSPPVPSKQVE